MSEPEGLNDQQIVNLIHDLRPKAAEMALGSGDVDAQRIDVPRLRAAEAELERRGWVEQSRGMWRQPGNDEPGAFLIHRPEKGTLG